jgi:intracellular septation protein A
MLLKIFINLVLPIIVLRWLSGVDAVGPTIALVIATTIPALYAIREYRQTKQLNMFSVIGFINTLFTGFIGFFELDRQLIVIKEAGVPFILAIIILITEFTGHSSATRLIGEIFDLNQIEQSYPNPNRLRTLMRRCAFMLAALFIALIPANYLLATFFIQSETGTVAFNQELARMMTWNLWLLTLPMIGLVTAIVFWLIGIFKRETNLSVDDFMRPWRGQ